MTITTQGIYRNRVKNDKKKYLRSPFFLKKKIEEFLNILCVSGIWQINTIIKENMAFRKLHCYEKCELCQTPKKRKNRHMISFSNIL